MKKFLSVLVLVLVLLAFGSAGAFAQCGMMGGDMQGSGMGMMGQGGMGMGMMGGMMGQGGMMQGQGGQRGGMRGDMMDDMMMDDDHPMWSQIMNLMLTDKQMDEIRAIKGRLMKETIKKKADKQIAKIELSEMLDKDPVDMKAVEASLKKVEALRTDIRLSHIKAREEIRSKLTPEQRKKLDEAMKMRQMGGMRGMGMMPMMMQPPKEQPKEPGKPEKKDEMPGMKH